MITFDQTLNIITVDGNSYPIQKIRKFNLALKFKETVMPILMSQLRPIELILAAVINEYAPSGNWGLVDCLSDSEKESDKCLLPALRIILDNCVTDSQTRYPDDVLNYMANDIDSIYRIVLAQMVEEKILEQCVRRKMGIISDLARISGATFNFDGFLSKAESIITLSGKRSPDPEFRSLEEVEAKA